ncbi:MULTISPECIES: hypothetical protein [unclassified Pseudonocardia]|uniref:hypothetical protein n=1 Tax=unclassified Pseudonocardia TaxID=2619320 RepID=UPI00111527E0|nr:MULTISPECIES: hypothetical protein [unclassified Pseudonocardia]
MSRATARDRVAQARAEGISSEVLAVAAHEVGHGVAFAAAGYVAGPARMRFGWLLGSPYDAGCKVGPPSTTKRTAPGLLVGYAAGNAAQRLFTDRYLGWFGGAGNGSYGDRSLFAETESYWESGLSWEQAERRAKTLLRPRLDRIAVLAVDLARTGHLPRGSFR